MDATTHPPTRRSRLRCPLRLAAYCAIALTALAGLALAYRALAQRSNEDRLAIDPARGIDWEGAIDVRGVRQWLQIRGQDRHNPILLSLHGGPGAPNRPLSYVIQPEWEDSFVVVNWDQPCAGQTYRLNEARGCGPLTIEGIVQDALVITDYLRKRFDRERIVLLGHSWGSLLGILLAQRAPERFYAYVGSGQIVSTERALSVGQRWALEQARAANDTEAIAALEARPTSRKLLWPYIMKYGGEHWKRQNSELWTMGLVLLAPRMTLHEVASWPRANSLTNDALRNEVRAFDAYREAGTRFALPIVFLLGRHDYNTPTPLAVSYFETLQAPMKKLVLFDDAAHMPMLENPTEFAAALKQYVLPLLSHSP